MEVIRTVNIASEFSDFLINRDEHQGDGKATGVDFRQEFLKEADSENWWKEDSQQIVLDFTGVDTLGPSWANEVFAYFTRFNINEKQMFKRFILRNISEVKQALINREVASGYKPRGN